MAGLFPPQDREWSLPSEAPLTAQAACRVAREAATQQGFAPAARALSADWALEQRLHPEHVRRWAEALGASAVARRDAELRDYQRGQRPACPPNAVPLLVLGMDGGRYQSREKDEESGSRWREEKVLTVSSYLPGDGKPVDEGGRAPQKLVTTHLATAQPARAFGPLARVEAERRGLGHADVVIALGDGGNWIDPLLIEHFRVQARIIDWFHAVEHLWDCARAAHGAGTPQAAQWAERLEALLWDGKVQRVIDALSAVAERLGPPAALAGADPTATATQGTATDGTVAAAPAAAATGPGAVLATNVGYFTQHREHMDYPAFRRRGWPIGSGETEAAVKQFNKRIKGTEQFWSKDGVEAIVTLRALWISQDGRWEDYWENRRAYVN